MNDRTPHNPNDVMLVPMTADALRLLRNAVEHSAYCHERDAASCPPKVKAVHQSTARAQRGIAADLALIFDGRSAVVGSSLIDARAAVYAADKASVKG